MQEHSIIQTGGKQFVVTPGSSVKIPSVSTAVGETITFDDLLGGAKVTATVTAHGKNPTVRIVKFKNKTRSIRRRGQRQKYTTIQIEAAK